MARLAVHASPVRMLLRALAGLVILLAAADVLWLHVLASPPEAGADGVLTGRGLNSQRLDVLWGGLLGLVGLGLAGSAVVEAARRRELLVVRPEGIEMWLEGPGVDAVFVPWALVRSVRSTVHTDETGSSPALEVRFDESVELPRRPWGAVWDGDRLLLDAESWNVRAVDVAVNARLAFDRAHHPPDGQHSEEEVPYV